MGLIYTISIGLYYGLMHIVALFNPKAKLWLQGRKDIETRIAESTIGQQKTILIHCSSLGEFEQGRPLLEKLKEKYSDYKVVLSFFSPSGYEVEKNNSLADLVLYLPLDSRMAVKRFVDKLNIEKAFFVKYEYWPNLFRALNSKGASIFMISAVFRENQFFFKPFAKWYRKNSLGLVKHFFVQNEQSGSILSKNGFQNFTIAGDTRFDRVAELSESEYQDSILEQFTQSDKRVLILGSSWPEDEKIALDFLSENKAGWKYIVAPHEIHEAHLKQIESIAKNISTVRYSQLSANSAMDEDVLIIDNIGKLKYLYRYADIAYIGGGFGAGIHNTLEAAAYAKPVIFGPNYHKFNEAKQLTEINAGISIQSIQDFESALKLFLDDYDQKSSIARNFVHQYRGATDKILQKSF